MVNAHVKESAWYDVHRTALLFDLAIELERPLALIDVWFGFTIFTISFSSFIIRTIIFQ
jgi:hypothetical protein